jgi:hypothetical protein
MRGRLYDQLDFERLLPRLRLLTETGDRPSAQGQNDREQTIRGVAHQRDGVTPGETGWPSGLQPTAAGATMSRRG